MDVDRGQASGATIETATMVVEVLHCPFCGARLV